MKVSQATTLVAALAASSAAIPTERAASSYDCAGPFIIAARGSGEPAGEGVQSEVVGLIKGKFKNWKGSDVGLDYPAVVNNNQGNYPPSVQAGIQNLTGLIEAYVNQCGSGSEIVLLGYSQGGQVVSSTLGGGEGQPALPSTYTKNIKAAVVFGDPTFVAGQSYDAGNATTSGVISGQGGTPETLAPYKSVFRSFCTAEDIYCASGNEPDSGTIHGQEVQTWAKPAAKFVAKQLRK